MFGYFATLDGKGHYMQGIKQETGLMLVSSLDWVREKKINLYMKLSVFFPLRRRK